MSCRDHELPDQLLPDHELPDQLLPFQVPPDQLLWSASRRGHRERVEALAEDVLLAGQDDAVAGQVIEAAGALEAPDPGRDGPRLDRGRQARS